MTRKMQALLQMSKCIITFFYHIVFIESIKNVNRDL